MNFSPVFLRKSAVLASVLVAAILVFGKLVVWVMTGSVSVFSSLMDSIVDVLASLTAAYGVYHAAKPADWNHRYGHAKAESLAVLAQAGFICVSAVLIGYEAISRLINTQPVQQIEIGIGFMLFATALTFMLVVFQQYVVRRTGSLAIGADRLHYTGDILMNVGVAVALLFSSYGFLWWLDSAFGLCVAAFLVWNIRPAALISLDVLMDHELPETEREEIKRIASSHPKVLEVHDLRTRNAGDVKYVEIHLEMDGATSLLEGHAVGEDVEKAICAAFSNAEVLVHLDPHGVEEHRRLDNVIVARR